MSQAIDSNFMVPIRTTLSGSLQEAAGEDVPEIRAYKLGKKRWSYNQVEMLICEAGGNRQLTVKQAAHQGNALSAQQGADQGVNYQLILANDEKLYLDAFLVYDNPIDVTPSGATTKQYEWNLVDRCACKRGCSGPILRAIQRFGKLGKRSWGASPSPDRTDRTNHNMKDQSYMYLSFDEAGTHVDATNFRLVTIVYGKGRETPLATAASPPVRVLANNDVPTGAAHLQLLVELPSTWSGWDSVPSMPVVPSFAARLAAATETAPAVGLPRLPSRKRQSSGDLSEDNHSLDAATTPLRLLPGQGVPEAPTHIYSTRRSLAYQQQQKKEHAMGGTPQNVSAPSSLLVEDVNHRMTPEVASSPQPPAVWLSSHQKSTVRTVDAGDEYYNSSAKRLRLEDIEATMQLPHSADYEPNFPGLVGNGTSAATAAALEATIGQTVNAVNDDSIAAFMELMVMNATQPLAPPPIIEVPPVSQLEHPVVQAFAHEQAEKFKAVLSIPTMNAPESEMNRPQGNYGLPGTLPALGTPTPSALEDYFDGIHAAFDSIIDNGIMNDDSSSVIFKASFAPSMY